MKRIRSESGFSLIELVIAATVLVVGVMSVLMALHACTVMTRATREQNVAMYKVETALEQIESTPFTQIPLLFPDETPIDIAEMLDTDPANDIRLNDEVLIVTYGDLDADPLVITATILWTDLRDRARRMSMTTLRAR